MIKRRLLSWFLIGVLVVSVIDVVPSMDVCAEGIGEVYAKRSFDSSYDSAGTIWAALTPLRKLHLKYGRRKRLRLCSADMKRAMAEAL